jgi:lysozyme
MKLSRKGAMALLAEEGIVLRAYQCSADVWTIGAGHTAAAGPPEPKKGMTITLEEALMLFRRDVEPFETQVLRAIKVPLKQHEFDALVLFHFNTGAIRSGSVDDKLNRGDRKGAMATFNQYVNVDGQRNIGLVNRRARETAMFERAEYFERAIMLEDLHGRRRNVMPASLPWPDDIPPPPDVEPPPMAPRAPAPAPEAVGWLAALIKLLLSIFRRTP